MLNLRAAALPVTLALAVVGTAAQQNPRMGMSGIKAPDTLKAIWDNAYVVVFVRVETEQPQLRPVPHTSAVDEVTIYQVRVLRHFRVVRRNHHRCLVGQRVDHL